MTNQKDDGGEYNEQRRKFGVDTIASILATAAVPSGVFFGVVAPYGLSKGEALSTQLATDFNAAITTRNLSLSAALLAKAQEQGEFTLMKVVQKLKSMHGGLQQDVMVSHHNENFSRSLEGKKRATDFRTAVDSGHVDRAIVILSEALSDRTLGAMVSDLKERTPNQVAR